MRMVMGSLFVLVGLILVQAVRAGEAQGDSVQVNAGPFHPFCAAAFKKLPIDEAGRATNESPDGTKVLVEAELGKLKEHYLRYAADYLAYDTACFFGWKCASGCLSDATREFLSNNAGALFIDEGTDGLVPFCTAFRISDDIIVTAAHCATLPNKQFRLFGDPHTPINVEFVAIRFGQGGSDLGDYALLRIAKPKLPFTWTSADFTREILPRQSIIIVAISNAVFAAKSMGVEDWLDAVRFSRTNASQVLPIEEVKPPPSTAEYKAECIYHTAPTFEGMSGAAILGVRRPASSSQSPRRYVLGIHIRNGALDAPCGNRPLVNIGIRIPAAVLKLVNK
ncbi:MULTISPECIES: trypsin-like serine protease [unclassified Mesorhizobium]|uniref:trypsin-like serine peptidase n=1 Tax=unclassified Mesorhizobium TaxID=325217 RepID=UPI0011274406|nr:MULTISPECIES: trypsin-like serine protease [unclassified Mesorhizobium]MCA0056831.1 serine protease [Mesorhizobium sp. B261B1A]TPL08201.1 trypsin-like peptidase domain-containing protein [Mesorhizobium sp. B2-4-11]